jgi:hypothetical protein
MPRALKPKTDAKAVGAPYRKSARGRKVVDAASLEPASISKMREINATYREEYGKSKHTLEQYRRYVRQGKDFLALLVGKRAGNKPGEQDDLDISLLAKAFDNPPNKTSVEALELFMVEKCFEKNCGESVATLIQAAFAWYWDNM